MTTATTPTPAPPAAARYYTATAPDGTVFFRQTANRAYTHSAFGQTGLARGTDTGEEWCNLGFSGSMALAEKNGRKHVTTYGWRGYVVVPAVEIPTRKEFMRLKKEAR